MDHQGVYEKKPMEVRQVPPLPPAFQPLPRGPTIQACYRHHFG